MGTRCWRCFKTRFEQLVNEEGGFDAVCRERRWTKISVKMGFAPGKAIGSHLRAHYERILFPYNLFQTGANLPVRPITIYSGFVVLLSNHHKSFVVQFSLLTSNMFLYFEFIEKYLKVSYLSKY